MPLIDNTINMPAIILVNLMGLIVLFSIFIGCDWRRLRSTNTVKALVLMSISIAVACVLEPLAYLREGYSPFLGYILNALVFFVHCIPPVAWVMMIASHLGVKISRLHKLFLRLYLIVSALVLILNFFIPLVFSVDSQGIYRREKGFIYLLVVGLAIAFDGVLVSYRARFRSDRIKFFLVWAFLAPALLGRVIQTAWYGVSTAVPFLAISVSCCALCLQNERLNRDSHTNLYNRAYLYALESRLSKHATHAYTIIFLDINSFKSINDTYGHVEGDKALIRVADVLREVVGDRGEVIRYAGDEFFVLFNSPDNKESEVLISSIDSALASLPVDPEKPYTLSVSSGYSSIDFRSESIDEVLDKSDSLMYEKKREYYYNNNKSDRRNKN